MATTNWNLAFSQLLRNTHPQMWGNWTLDATIQPGAVGVVDPSTGSFRYLAMLPGADVKQVATSSDWKVQSSSVTQTEASVDLGGNYTDPETQTKVSAGLEVTWSFGESGSISSTFTVVEQAVLDDLGSQLMAQHDWLLAQANSVGMAQGSTITQGFGVVSSVLLASGGLNLGAQTSSSSFSIKGSVDATNTMAGAGGSAKGSYSTTNETAAFEQHLWPAAANEVPPSPIPIAFEFTSFVGDGILPGWITNVSGIGIQLDDAHGGTYVVDATATYSLGGTTHSTSASVSGGLTNMMDPIPPEATNLELQLTFKGFTDEHHHFSWASPIEQFPNGQIIIDLYGVWPSAGKAVERTTGESG